MEFLVKLRQKVQHREVNNERKSDFDRYKESQTLQPTNLFLTPIGFVREKQEPLIGPLPVLSSESQNSSANQNSHSRQSSGISNRTNKTNQRAPSSERRPLQVQPILPSSAVDSNLNLEKKYKNVEHLNLIQTRKTYIYLDILLATSGRFESTSGFISFLSSNSKASTPGISPRPTINRPTVQKSESNSSKSPNPSSFEKRSFSKLSFCSIMIICAACV